MGVTAHFEAPAPAAARRVGGLHHQEALPQDPVQFLAPADVQAQVEGRETLHVGDEDGRGAAGKLREGGRDRPTSLCHYSDGKVHAGLSSEGEGGGVGVEEGVDELFAGGGLVEHALAVLGIVDPVLDAETGDGRFFCAFFVPEEEGGKKGRG